MHTTILQLEGMHCDGCARQLQRLLTGQSGVAVAEVSYARREARVLHDPALASPERLCQVVERAGFQASATP